MKMIDIDHMEQITLDESQAIKLKYAFDRDEIENADCDTVYWDDSIDSNGDLCLDEEAFSQCKEVLGL